MLVIDFALFYFLYNLAGQSSFLDGSIVFFATYLAYILIVLFLALVVFSGYQKREKLEILLVVGLSSLIARFGVTELVRFFIHRPRPFITLSIHPLFTDSAWSFPSGHATFFFATATAVYLYRKKWGIAFFVGAMLISLARIAAGVHYPSDILGGALIGVLVAYVTYYLVRKLAAQQPS